MPTGYLSLPLSPSSPWVTLWHPPVKQRRECEWVESNKVSHIMSREYPPQRRQHALSIIKQHVSMPLPVAQTFMRQVTEGFWIFKSDSWDFWTAHMTLVVKSGAVLYIFVNSSHCAQWKLGMQRRDRRRHHHFEIKIIIIIIIFLWSCTIATTRHRAEDLFLIDPYVL